MSGKTKKKPNKCPGFRLDRIQMDKKLDRRTYEKRLEAQQLLREEGISAAVVSMPCWELFKQQPAAYRAEVLGSAPRVGVEAAVRNDWDQWLTPEGGFVGMTGFGASAPAEQLYEHFGITADAVAAAARDLVN
mgnify:CR=1 FL=1